VLAVRPHESAGITAVVIDNAEILGDVSHESRGLTAFILTPGCWL
jgi:hypothetical protein